MAHGLAEAFLLFKLHYDYIGEKGSGSLDVINEHIVNEAFLLVSFGCFVHSRVFQYEFLHVSKLASLNFVD